MDNTLSKSIFLAAGGHRLVKQLFIENDWVGEKHYAVYSLSRNDKTVNGKVYPSLHRLYVEEDDITEARFVEKYLYDLEQWNKIAASAMLKDEVAKWREDIKLKTIGKLVDELTLDALSGSKSSKSSAKFLIDKLSKEAKGRPSNAKTHSVAAAHELSSDLAEDLKRMQVN